MIVAATPRKRLWLWVALFIWLAVLLATLATGWNVVIVRDYQRIAELARSVSIEEVAEEVRGPWLTLFLGTLGFVAALGTMILFFVRLLREMRLNQVQSEFLATVSHELKTPIASLELSSSLLRSGTVSSAEAERLWESHHAELQRLRAEVETLLEAARWSAAPSTRSDSETIQLDVWIRESFPRWRALLGDGASLELVGEPLGAGIHGSRRALNLIADNLIDNARKFSRGSPRVRVRTVGTRHGWQVRFEDEGWGFDPKWSRKIFDRFVRVKNGAPYAIPGTGLGLYLARTASGSMGLTLSGESPGSGQGAAFVLSGRNR